MLILHYTGMQTGAAAVERLCDPAAQVSAHYVVEEDGRVFNLVAEEQRAWHAGVSFWRGRSGLNDGAVGVEIVNPGHEWGYRAFPRAQMVAVRDLCLGIIGRHGIVARNVVAHSDVAPNRKQDPGELFDWRFLAAAGVGLWTDAFAPSQNVAADLAEIGYDMRHGWRDVVTAFQRHFLPGTVTGEVCAQTAGRAAAVVNLLKNTNS
jgi:N-acetylmuramoyl-L-alanine amidase